ncbi:MAG TPA: D-2-hydroxyacid dehydrogenase [Longimicrobiales bacterium]|nr:D-2-hydroxyacid dehydrogenase [Longimicrobiales bacterium]
MLNVLVCSYLEPEHLERIRAVDPSVHVTFRPDLIRVPRYVADHIGEPLERTVEQAQEWGELMAGADVLFDFDYADPGSLLREGRRVRWVQASSAGIGGFVQAFDLHRSDATFTTAAGVHARPLAEFVLFGMLAFANNYPQARRQQREARWQRFVGGEIEGATLAIVGLGSIGREVARLASLAGVRVIGTKRTTEGLSASDLGVDALYDWRDLHDMVGQADYVCLIAPQTPETAGMMDAAAFAAMKPGSVLINIGRGGLVVEEALVDALDRGPLAGAVLDVTPTEPLPDGHPLWSRDDVIVFPHSASTSVRENERLTKLFCDNLRSFQAGTPLRNVYRHERGY